MRVRRVLSAQGRDQPVLVVRAGGEARWLPALPGIECDCLRDECLVGVVRLVVVIVARIVRILAFDKDGVLPLFVASSSR